MVMIEIDCYELKYIYRYTWKIQYAYECYSANKGLIIESTWWCLFTNDNKYIYTRVMIRNYSWLE